MSRSNYLIGKNIDMDLCVRPTPTSNRLFKQMKRNADAMVENDYRVDVKYDPLGDREFYIVDRTGRIVG